jgi:hypothetical protein
MAFWDTIKKGYKKVDEKLGGYLPGGTTPEEVREKKETQPIKQEAPQVQEQPKEKEKTFIDKAKEVGEMAIKGIGSKEVEKGTPEQKQQKIINLQNEIQEEKAKITGGDKFDFLYSRERKIAENEKEIERLQGGGSLEKPPEYAYNIMPLDISGISGGGGATMARTGTGAFAKVGGLSQKAAGAQKAGSITGNIKNLALIKGALKKVFSLKTLGLLGGATGSMFLGQWAQAEAPEPISITMKDLLRKSKETGDWTLYEDGQRARNEITDLKKWEQILMWSPASVAVGIPNKIKGAITAGQLMDKLAEDEKIQQETGESDDERWERIHQEAEEREEQRRQDQLEFEKDLQRLRAEAKANDRKLDEKYWKQVEKDRQERLEKDREAELKFREEYLKLWNEIKSANAPSKLNFGLL